MASKHIEKKDVSDSDHSDREEYEGGEGNIILESLMRVRAKHAQNQNKWQDKSRFGKVASKVKKDVKVEERVKRQAIKQKISAFLAGKADVPSPRGAHSPNTRTLGVWIDQARKSSRSKSRSRGGTPRQNKQDLKRQSVKIDANGNLVPAPEGLYGDILAGRGDLARNTEIVTSTSDNLASITIPVPKKANRKTKASHNVSVDGLLKAGKRMREVARASSPNLSSSLYTSSASPAKKRMSSKRKTTMALKQPEMTFNKDPESGVSGGVFTSPAVNRSATSYSAGKRLTSAKKASPNKRASYMQPTFSKQMLLARSGQISALVGTTRQGRPVVLETQNANSPTVHRASDFSFAPSPATGKKKRPTSVKKALRSSIYNSQAAPLSMSGIKNKYQVNDVSQLNDQALIEDVVPEILSGSAKKQKMVSPANRTYVRETVQNGPAEAYNTAALIASSHVDGGAKKAKIAEMDAAFESLQGELAHVRAKKNVDFYDDHNKNYYKGQLKRDQTRTSVKVIQDKNDEALAQQYQDRVYGKQQLGFKVDKRTSKIATKNPLAFVEKEVARTSLK